jgi:hypothetical protein
MGAFAWNPNDFSGGGGSGNVNGPASSTDNAFARFDGTTGKLLQNSVCTQTDAGAVTLGASGGTQTHTVNGNFTGFADSGGTTRLTIDHANVAMLFPTSTGYVSGVGDVGINIDSNNNTGNAEFVVGKDREFGSGGLDLFFINENGGYGSPFTIVTTSGTINALSTATAHVRLNSSSAKTLNGISAGVDGEVLRIINLNAALTVNNLNGSAGVNDQITTGSGGAITITSDGAVTFVYDGTSAKWRVTSIVN